MISKQSFISDSHINTHAYWDLLISAVPAVKNVSVNIISLIELSGMLNIDPYNPPKIFCVLKFNGPVDKSKIFLGSNTLYESTVKAIFLQRFYQKQL